MVKKARKTGMIVNGKVLEAESTPLGLQHVPDLRPLPVVDLDAAWRVVESYPCGEGWDEVLYVARGYVDGVLRREMEAR